MVVPRFDQRGQTLAVFPWLTLAAAISSCLLAGCDSSPAGRRGAAASTVDAPRDAASIWANSCAQCHRRTELRGRTAKDIRKALSAVPEMRRLAPLSSDELGGLEQLLSSPPPGASAPPPK